MSNALTLTTPVAMSSIASVELASAALDFDGSQVVLSLRLKDAGGGLLSNATLIVTGAQASAFLANNKTNIMNYLQTHYGAGTVT